MSNKKNTKVIILIILLAALLVLWGCGDNNGDNDQSDAEDPNGQEVSDEDPADEDSDTDDEESADDSEGDFDDESESEEATETEEDLESIFAAMTMPDSLSYDLTVTGEEMEEYTSQFWIKGEKLRTEAEFDGQTFISIQDEEFLYTLDPQTMTGMKMPLDMDIPTGTGENAEEDYRADDYLEDSDYGGLTLLGTETINGMDTYMISDTSEGFDQTLWIHQEYGIPVRVEAAGNQPEDQFIMNISNLEVGDISDDLFEPPEDYEINEIGQ